MKCGCDDWIVHQTGERGKQDELDGEDGQDALLSHTPLNARRGAWTLTPHKKRCSKRGHNVTRTPQPGLPFDADDDFQLLWANAQGRVIFTHNIRDFICKTEAFLQHSGILLVHRSSFSLADLIRLLDCALTTIVAEDCAGQVRWLLDWNNPCRPTAK